MKNVFHIYIININRTKEQMKVINYFICIEEKENFGNGRYKNFQEEQEGNYLTLFQKLNVANIGHNFPLNQWPNIPENYQEIHFVCFLSISCFSNFRIFI